MTCGRSRAQATGNESGTSTDAASGGSETAGMGDAIVDALQRLLRVLVTPIEGFVQTYGNELLGLIVGTPHPDVIFQPPKMGLWQSLYQYYWNGIVPLALLLFGLAVGLVILLESTSHLFSGYHRANLKRRAFAGLLGILSWWWLAGFSLTITDQLATFLTPDLSNVSLFQTASFTAIGVLGVVVALTVDLSLFLLIALVYFLRQLVLYAFVLGMPLLIVCWIPGVGPFSFVARFAQRLAGFYVPFLLMPVPVALLIRLSALLGESVSLSLGGVGMWIGALVIPFVAVLIPFVFVWQAGSLFQFVGHMERHASRERLRENTAHGYQNASQAVHTGRNTARGLRGKPERRSDGQTLLQNGPGESRGYRAGRGLRTTPARLREAFSVRTNTGEDLSATTFDRYEPREYDIDSRWDVADRRRNR